MHVAISSASCKRRVRVRRATAQDEIDQDIAAFVAGKRDAATPLTHVGCPYLAKRNPRLAALWWRGRRFAQQEAQGLRPIDTIRRKGAQEAGRP